MKQAGENRPAYSFKPFKYNSHYWILYFLSRARKPSRILDIGAAGGYLGAALQQQGHSVVGVESDLALAEQARAHYQTLHRVDVEKYDFPYRGEFDYILLADILEHLRNPVDVLRRVLPCLNRQGEVIISVPNVAHLFVRLNLMLGRFEYDDRGILDRTHLRFFTLASLRRMVHEASCRIIELQPTPAPVQLVLPWTGKPAFDPMHELHFLSVKVCKTLLAYQYVLRAVPEQNQRSRTVSM